jgi:hypothetical protein
MAARWFIVAKGIDLDVCGSVHHSTIQKEKSNKMQKCIKSLLFHIYMKPTCFGRHTAHHQEPKTALAGSGFLYVEGCWTCSWRTINNLPRTITVPDNVHQLHVQQPSTYDNCAWQRPPATRPTAFHVWKTRGCQCSFRLLMMGCVSPETCWALYKYGIIKFDKLLHLVGFFFMNCHAFCWKVPSYAFF